MNSAIRRYTKQWFPEEPTSQPCLTEMEAHEDDLPGASSTCTAAALNVEPRTTAKHVLVTSEDYGQSISPCLVTGI
jgi:hypothetical protein